MKLFAVLLLIASSCGIISGQELMDSDRHNTSYNAGWLSCIEAPNPNGIRTSGHWIMYDLRSSYNLKDLHLWNMNAPSRSKDGISQLVIDVSEDGEIWTEVGTYALTMAEGSGYYMGESIPGFGASSVRYVLITALANHGGTCYGFSEVRFGVGEASLPVDLVDFDIQCEDGNREITWITENEVNNAGFYIEKSYDGILFTELTFIEGKNNLNKSTYTVNDNDRFGGMVWYKLSQMDYDGRKTSYPIQENSCGSPDGEIYLTPNPSYGQINFQYQPIGEMPVSIEIYDLTGKMLDSRNIGHKSYISEQLDFTSLPPGTYVLQAKDGNYQYRKRFIKM